MLVLYSCSKMQEANSIQLSYYYVKNKLLVVHRCQPLVVHRCQAVFHKMLGLLWCWNFKLDLFKKINYGPFLCMGFNCLKATEPLWIDSLLFTTQSQGFPGTHLIDHRRMKCWVNLGATQWFWMWDPWIENLAA